MSVSLQDLALKLNEKKLEQGITQAVRMDFSFVPKKEKSLVRLNGQTICSAGNVFFIIASPGSGKSSVCEAIASGGVNPKCDALGFEINSDKTLLVDTERVLNDFYRGMHRIKKRSGVDEEVMVKRLDLFSFIKIDSTEACKSELKHILSYGSYELVIIDGSADFVKSVNDEDEAKSFWRWIIGLANEKNFGVVITIHPNPGDPEGKATGHLGSQGQKKAESVFNVRRSAADDNVREITTDTGHGKVRNANDKITASFTWDDKEGMFVSCESAISRKVRHIKDLFTEEKTSYRYKELCRAWMDATGKSLSNARLKIKEAETMEDIVHYLNVYTLNGSREEEVIEGNGDINVEEDVVPF